MTSARATLDDVAWVVGEPTRLRILAELLGGVPLPAGALAARVGVAPSTASGHLAHLVAAGLIEVRADGRTRLAQLTRPEVAEAVESLLNLTSEAPSNSLNSAKRQLAMRAARSCYDHLAGRCGVLVAEQALARGWVVEEEGGWTLGKDQPADLGHALGIPVTMPRGRRGDVRPCTDWTERRPHLAGRLGAGLLTALLDARWVERHPTDRALTVTADGVDGLRGIGIHLS